MKKFDPTKIPASGGKKPSTTTNYSYNANQVAQDVAWCITQLKERHIDLTADYQDWVIIGFSIGSLGEAGRALYHDICSQHPDYDYAQTDEKYTSLLKDRDGSLTIATFFQYCKDHGITFKGKPREIPI